VLASGFLNASAIHQTTSQPPQQGDAENPISDQYLPAFVITDDDGKPVGVLFAPAHL